MPSMKISSTFDEHREQRCEVIFPWAALICVDVCAVRWSRFSMRLGMQCKRC